MDTKKFIENFAEALELEDASVLSVETAFRDLEEWDSLAYLNIIAMIDEEFDLQIENADFRKLNTISDIIAFIEAQQ